MTEEVTTQEFDQEQPDSIQLQEYGLAEFIKQIEVKVNQGYRLDLDSNEGYPQQYGTMFTARMLKTDGSLSYGLAYMEGYSEGKEWGLANSQEKQSDQVKFDVPKEPMFLKTADEVVIPDVLDVVALTEVVGVNEITETPVKVDGRTKQAKAK